MDRVVGLWTGQSSSDAGDETEWEPFVFVQGPSRDALAGCGWSKWRGITIPFLLSGQLSVARDEDDLNGTRLELTKEHVGRFNNKVKYTMLLGEEAGSDGKPEATLIGRYQGGFVTLRRIGPAASALAWLLSGTWLGESVAHAGERTQWTDTDVQWEADDDETVCLTGHGSSLWRGMTIEFNLRGTLDVATGSVRIEKEHTGVYTNKIDYAGEMVACDETAAGGAKGLQIQGSYGSGSILLHRLPDEAHVDHFTGYALSALQSARDGPSRRPSSVASSTDAGPPQWERSAAEPDSPPPEPLSGMALATAGLPLSDAVGLGTSLSDVWHGESVDTSTRVRTSWADTELRVRVPGRPAGTPNTGYVRWLELSGHGVSLWRDQRIPFTLAGRVDLSTGAVELLKTHEGAYTNQVQYGASLCEVQPCDVDMAYFLSGNVSARILGHYSSGTLSLARGRGTPARPRHDDDDNAESSDYHGAESKLDMPDRVSSPAEGQADSPQLERYRLFLRGILGNSATPSERESEVLSRYRTMEGITDAEHRRVVAEEGAGSTAGAGAKEETSHDGHGEKQEDDLCKVCMDATINSVLLPCGHLCVCFPCGRQLQPRLCPICRINIGRVQVVYKS